MLTRRTYNPNTLILTVADADDDDDDDDDEYDNDYEDRKALAPCVCLI